MGQRTRGEGSVVVRLRCGGLAGQWAVEGTQRGDLVDRGEGVEGAGIADERLQLGHDVHEQCAVVADVAVGGASVAGPG